MHVTWFGADLFQFCLRYTKYEKWAGLEPTPMTRRTHLCHVCTISWNKRSNWSCVRTFHLRSNSYISRLHKHMTFIKVNYPSFDCKDKNEEIWIPAHHHQGIETSHGPGYLWIVSMFSKCVQRFVVFHKKARKDFDDLPFCQTLLNCWGCQKQTWMRIHSERIIRLCWWSWNASNWLNYFQWHFCLSAVFQFTSLHCHFSQLASCASTSQKPKKAHCQTYSRLDKNIFHLEEIRLASVSQHIVSYAQTGDAPDTTCVQLVPI